MLVLLQSARGSVRTVYEYAPLLVFSNGSMRIDPHGNRFDWVSGPSTLGSTRTYQLSLLPVLSALSLHLLG